MEKPIPFEEWSAPHADAAGEAMAQTIAAYMESMATNAADVGENATVTVTIWVQQASTSSEELFALMNTWLNSVSFGVVFSSLVVSSIAVLIAIFGFTGYTNFQSWINASEKKTLDAIDAKVEEKLRETIAGEVPLTTFKPFHGKEGEKNDRPS